MTIVEVWRSNFEQEMLSIESIVRTTSYHCISLDTEFPGFLSNTPRNATETERYLDMRFNVDRLKPIQFGLTFADKDGNLPQSGGVWQFNFDDFDPAVDLHVTSSIELLRRKGIDMEKNKREGIDIKSFAARFKNIISGEEAMGIQWITFHGLYDIAYFIKVLYENKPMPGSIQEFMSLVGATFPRICDLKFIARFCHGLLGGELGLERMAKILRVKRTGESHQAGSDCLVTSNVFSEMKKLYGLVEGHYEGYFYGISFRALARWVPPLPHLPFITVVPNTTTIPPTCLVHAPLYYAPVI